MQANRLAFDALILAGGRSSRLGGMPKQSLVFQGRTLLQQSVAAAAGALHTVIVGDTGSLPHGAAASQRLSPPIWPANLLLCREEPRFAGPAAAIAAGLHTLAENGGGAPYTLVLACDMPLASQAVKALKEALTRTIEAPAAQSTAQAAAQPLGGAAGQSGVMACAEDGRAQPLAGLYSTPELIRACNELAARNRLVNGSVRALLANLDVQLVTVPSGSTSDVDTWDDAAALGIDAGIQHGSQDRRSGGANVGGKS